LTVNQSGASASFTNAGTVTLGSGITFLINGGTYNQTTGTVSGAGTFSLSGVTANLAADITNATTALTVTNTTINGPGKLTNATNQTLTLQNSTIGATSGLVNQGTLITKGSVNVNGPLSTAAGSLFRVLGDNIVGSTTTTIANGFTNVSGIELTSAGGG